MAVCHIGILVFDGVEELDFVGPWEVFRVSEVLLNSSDGGGSLPSSELIPSAVIPEHSSSLRYKVVTIAESLDKPITCAKGLRVLADFDFDSHPLLSVLVVPGGEGTRRLVDDREMLDWIARVARTADWVSSVCTGAFLLHAAGPARGKRVATHWAHENRMEERGDVEVVRSDRFVVDGNVVTSQGVSAGIDMSLWLVGQLHSPDHARKTQRHMHYDPEPPYSLGN